MLVDAPLVGGEAKPGNIVSAVVARHMHRASPIRARGPQGRIAALPKAGRY